MRKYIVLLIVLLAAAMWLEPLLRATIESQAPHHSWIPVVSDGVWSTISMLLWLGAAVLAVAIVVRIGMYVWREVVD